jgi:uncharacterized protein
MNECRLVLDTNVFVAAGFEPKSASARLLEALRQGRCRMIWHRTTRRETERVLRRVPPLDCADPARRAGDQGAPAV